MGGVAGTVAPVPIGGTGGTVQAALMNPGVPTGVRRRMTLLDWAALDDVISRASGDEGGATRILAPESSSIHRRRSAGYAGSTGRKAPPALLTARRATTISGDRSSEMATTDSAPTPSATSRRASRLARAFSSA